MGDLTANTYACTNNTPAATLVGYQPVCRQWYQRGLDEGHAISHVYIDAFGAGAVHTDSFSVTGGKHSNGANGVAALDFQSGSTMEMLLSNLNSLYDTHVGSGSGVYAYMITNMSNAYEVCRGAPYSTCPQIQAHSDWDNTLQPGESESNLLKDINDLECSGGYNNPTPNTECIASVNAASTLMSTQATGTTTYTRGAAVAGKHGSRNNRPAGKVYIHIYITLPLPLTLIGGEGLYRLASHPGAESGVHHCDCDA